MTSSPYSPACHAFAPTLQKFKTTSGKEGKFYSLPRLAEQFPALKRLPVSIRIVLESVLRHCDGQKILPEHVAQLAQWQPQAERKQEIPFIVSRVILQDFTGVPLLADLAAMRNVALQSGQNPKKIEPLVPVDLVIDHSIMVDHYGQNDSLDLNMKLEFQRNRERYEFMKWGMQAIETFNIVPPGFGIVHQVNLEYLARGVHQSKDRIYYPDTLVGTDSHTTMINSMGVVGWGVGGIEAEAAMLGQPVYLLTPDVVGVELAGQLREGVTATDLVLTITELLREYKVVGKFVEFFGEGTRNLTLPDRATIANMAPEYGATMGFFPVDDKTIAYFKGTGRTKTEIEAFEAYFRAQELFGVPLAGDIDYSQVVQLDLGCVTPSMAGPKRPQDRIELGQVADRFTALFGQSSARDGFGQNAAHLLQRCPVGTDPTLTLGNGDVLIAAITSCTNTSNPSVLLAAGLLAKKAVKAGLRVKPHIKTSLAPGSRIVTQYLRETGLLPYLEKLGFALAGYGCTTCIGNSGDLTPELNAAIQQNDLVCAAVLSGNRNFEARIHPNIKANFLASPPLVVAYAIAGTVLTDVMTQPVGQGKNGRNIYLGDIWPSSEEIDKLMKFAMKGKAFRENYAKVKSKPGKLWQEIGNEAGTTYTWPASTYIAEPPFFANFAINTVAANEGAARATAPKALGEINNARIMALLGDSITTDHISPAGSISENSPAGQWLLTQGVAHADFNSYGARRGHHEVMVRGTFANVRIKNFMLPPLDDGAFEEGGITLFQNDGPLQGEKMFIFDAAQQYLARGTPTVVFAGEEYGTGSSRDWAAKGTQLLGIKAVIARSFERIHRSNLVGMGVLPLQLRGSDSWQSLGLTGEESIDVLPDAALTPQSEATVIIYRTDGTKDHITVTLRIDTPIEVDYYRAGGILPYVLQQLLGTESPLQTASL